MQVDRIIQGDCFRVLKTIPDSCVDFVFADPPYGIKKAVRDSSYVSGFETECLRVARRGIAVTPGQENIAKCVAAFGDRYKGIVAARNKNGIGYGPWTHIDGWSDAVVEYIREAEPKQNA